MASSPAEPSVCPAAPRATPADHLPGFDWTRSFAAFAIIWWHALEAPALLPMKPVMTFAVPYFAATAVFFACRSGLSPAPGRGMRAYAGQRFWRLYVPFLAWTALYALLRIANHVALNGAWPHLSYNLLWTGSAHHLWFLPFVLMLTLVGHGLGRLLAPSAVARGLGAAVCLALALAALAVLMLGVTVDGGDYTLGRTLTALPASLAAVALCLALGPTGVDALRTGWVTALGLAAALACPGLTLLVDPGSQHALANAGGLGLFLFSFGRLLPAVAWVRRLGELAFSIYLAHILFVEGMQDVLSAVLKVPVSPGRDVAVFLFASVCSTLVALLIQRVRGLRWLGA